MAGSLVLAAEVGAAQQQASNALRGGYIVGGEEVVGADDEEVVGSDVDRDVAVVCGRAIGSGRGAAHGDGVLCEGVDVDARW